MFNPRKYPNRTLYSTSMKTWCDGYIWLTYDEDDWATMECQAQGIDENNNEESSIKIPDLHNVDKPSHFNINSA